MRRITGYAIIFAGALALAQSKQTPTAAQALKTNFEYINNKILAMAEDSPPTSTITDSSPKCVRSEQ